jgi:L-iditol 2-dehydrogenase
VRVAVLHGPGDVRIETRPTPAPGPGEVLLAMEGALTGGTVAKTVRRGGHARFGRPPLPLGHEGVGRIEALGAGMTGWRAGERVLPGDSGSCGACGACRKGRTELCAHMTWLTGFFADHLLVPARIVAQSLHRVPPGLAPEVAALADNLACVLKGRDETPGHLGETALVLGAGPLGLLWTWALARDGARVTTSARQAGSLAPAPSFGATSTARVDEVERCVAGGERFDLVVEAVGSPEAWALALAAVAPGGRVQLFGGPPDGTTLPLDARRLHYEELTLTASFHHAPRHLEAALTLLAGPGPWHALVNDVPLPLDALPQWAAQREPPAGARKVFIRP